MKITKLFFALAIVTLAFASCKKSDDLTNVIPADVPYVIHFDTKSLVKKSNYDIFQNVTVSRAINMGKAFLSKEEAIEMLDAFTKDVNTLGLNLKEDCYIYTDYAFSGIVLGVNDAEKIKSALINFSIAEEDEITVENGIYIYHTNSAAIGWTKDKFLMLAEMNPYFGSEGAQLVEMVKKQLKQGEKESINSNPAFANFLQDKKDITLFYGYSSKNLDIIEKISSTKLSDEAKNELNQMTGVSAITSASFEKGEIKSETKIYYETPETEKKYKELATKFCGKLNGDQLKYIPESSIFLASININGENIYNYLEKLKIIEMMEDPEAEEVSKTVLNGINGDLTFALTNILKVKKSYMVDEEYSYEYDSTEPEYALIMECKDAVKMLDLAKGKVGLEEKNVTEIGENMYSMEQSGLKQYFGVSGNSLYLTNNEAVFNSLKDKKGQSSKYQDITNGNIAIMGGNLKPLKTILEKEMPDDEVARSTNEIMTAFAQFFDAFDGYSYVVGKDLTSNGKVEMSDKSKNSFETICKLVDDILISLNDKFGL